MIQPESIRELEEKSLKLIVNLKIKQKLNPDYYYEKVRRSYSENQ